MAGSTYSQHPVLFIFAITSGRSGQGSSAPWWRAIWAHQLDQAAPRQEPSCAPCASASAVIIIYNDGAGPACGSGGDSDHRHRPRGPYDVRCLRPPAPPVQRHRPSAKAAHFGPASPARTRSHTHACTRSLMPKRQQPQTRYTNAETCRKKGAANASPLPHPAGPDRQASRSPTPHRARTEPRASHGMAYGGRSDRIAGLERRNE